jgi:hypothetical protein
VGKALEGGKRVIKMQVYLMSSLAKALWFLNPLEF